MDGEVYKSYKSCIKSQINENCAKFNKYFTEITLPIDNCTYYNTLSKPFGKLYNAAHQIPETSPNNRLLEENDEKPVSYFFYSRMAQTLPETIKTMSENMDTLISFFFFFLSY